MITSFCIEWHNWGEITPVYHVATETTKVFRRKKLLTTGQHNGIGNAFITASISLSQEKCDYLFSLIDTIVSEASGKDYMQKICDGYYWRLLTRHSDKHVQIIEGTTIAPNTAYELELAIRDILHSEAYMGRPHLFGIC